MAPNAPEFRLRCPACGKAELIQESRFLSDPEPTPYIVCRMCGWAAVKEQGVRDAIAAGRAVYQRDLDDLLTQRRAADAAGNAERAEQERQKRIAQAGNTVRAWAASPVADRVVNRGTWQVRLPELDPGVALDDLDEGVRSVYGDAKAEAELEADRLNAEAAARIAAMPAEQRRLSEEQAKREAEERRRRREEQSDVVPV